MTRELKIRELQLEEQSLTMSSNRELLKLDMEYEVSKSEIKGSYDHQIELLRAKVEVELKDYPAAEVPAVEPKKESSTDLNRSLDENVQPSE